MRSPRHYYLVIASLTAPLLLAALHDYLSAEAVEQLDGGTFTIFLNEARVGEEQFVIRQERSGSAGPLYRAGGVQNLKLNGQTMRISVALEATGERAHPRRYEAEINGGSATSIVGTIVSDRLRLDVRSPQGEEMREFLVRGPAVFLDRRIAHQYFFVAKVLGDEESSDLHVITPQDRKREAYRIEDQGQETLAHGERELTVQHLVLSSETGVTRHVWLDGDRVIRVEIPAEGFVAVRSDAASQSATNSRGPK